MDILKKSMWTRIVKDYKIKKIKIYKKVKEMECRKCHREIEDNEDIFEGNLCESCFLGKEIFPENKKENWKCRDCKTFTLSEANRFMHMYGGDILSTNSLIKVCTTCGRIYDENGNDKLINGKKVYLKAGRILLEGEEETSLIAAMI